MKINRKYFLGCLKGTKPGLSNKDIVELSTSFVFARGSVSSYNDQVAITYPIKDFEIEGAVRASALLSLLSKLRVEEILISIMGNKFVIHTTGKPAINTGLALEDITPNMKQALEQVGKRKRWNPLPKYFSEAVGFCLPSAAKDMSKPALTCLHFDGEYMEASDNFRLTSVELPGAKLPDILVPATSLAHLGTFLATHISYEDHWVHFKNQHEAMFSCRIVEDKFPDIEPILNKEATAKVRLPKELIEGLDRAMVMMEDTHNNVSVELTKKEAVVKSLNSIGWYTETLPASYTGKPMVFSIDPLILADILGHSTNAEIVEDTMLRFKGDMGFLYTHCCAMSSNKG